jgi:putative transcriptional regulator
MPRKSEPRLANGVRDLRAKSGMTQQELADQVGVTRQTIIALEGEAYTPSLALALRIAQAFVKPVEKVFWFER